MLLLRIRSFQLSLELAPVAGWETNPQALSRLGILGRKALEVVTEKGHQRSGRIWIPSPRPRVYAVARSFLLADRRPSAEKIQNRPLTDKSPRNVLKAETTERRDCNGCLPNPEMCAKLSGRQNSLTLCQRGRARAQLPTEDCGIDKVLPRRGGGSIDPGLPYSCGVRLDKLLHTNQSFIHYLSLIQVISQDCWEVFLLLHKRRLEEKSWIRIEHFSPLTLRLHPSGD